ncbi:hypothetical protein PYW08_004875 [Mythimna loreyi]|uniref:Uncharacterized protein n=1 Tax=Mythimna loreyi TaxID=667449 RepID=A0ACC2QFC4_9NEOP|nr:hypothetical protein PYW08_004875 [Mythimna loreyi]
MNVDPVIADDDVDMDAVVILDEDDENTHSEKRVDVLSAPTVETIDLDDESPIITSVETLKNNATSDKISEISFRINLANNRLMDKIVTTCINMENAIGMPRVVYKTLLPLYRDTNNRFKESDAFRALLKRTYKLLVRDPDHKFLHIKTLCEELKSGGLRRKVPFVTLATNVKNNSSQWENEELTTSSREINHNVVEDRQDRNQVRKVYRNTRKKLGGTATRRKAKRAKKPNIPAKDKIKTRSVTNAEKETTDIIDLDDSETETDSQKSDGQNDVIVIEETEHSDQKNDYINTVTHPETESSDKKNDNINTVTHAEIVEEDSNKENNDKNGQSSENEMDFDLLIPANICNTVLEDQPDECEVSDAKNIEIARLEKQIELDKKMIDKLEEEEVLTENPRTSAYYLCSKYKENIVECYKRICELKGDCKELVKRREIRLRVTKGHPPGPAERLEEFLNDSIDETGAVQFPDFSDVVQCVVDSNYIDNLGWTGQQVIQEAIALFRQCGQALRKRRQKREYQDLLSLIRDKGDTDDPAERDPVLLAKLEENKLIAKRKEDEILNRYVSMERDTLLKRYGTNPHEAATAEFESDEDSSDSECEEDITIPNNITTCTINQPEIREPSKSNINLGVNTGEPLRSNINLGVNTGEPLRSNINLGVNTGEPSRSNINLGVNQPERAEPSRSNINLGVNQTQRGDSSRSNTNLLQTNNIMPTPSNNNNETTKSSNMSDKERINSKVATTVSETVSSNGATTNNSDKRIATNVRNEDREVNYEPCKNSDVQNNVSSTTDGVENCDSSISTEVKTEDVKREPLDIQSMLDQLEDGFVTQIFDIEDPFLVIEISSDDSTDDEDL